MIDIRQDIDSIDAEIMSGLKDFQQATVRYIDALYRGGQKRILVSDEVGLGKTLIAKGMVAKLAKLRLEEGDHLFKVIYICSNAAIAGQNLNKLRITRDLKVESTGSSRLSMQHLNIFRQDHDPELLKNYIQLIPLTPETSFRMTSGTGSVEERALMYAILKRLPDMQPHLKALEIAMIDYAHTAWHGWARKWYDDQVLACNESTSSKYLSHMLAETARRMTDSATGESLLAMLIHHCQQIADNGYKLIKGTEIIGRLRVMFAQISIDLLQPDFVIMDEFQRFKYLIDSSEDTETGMLARRFFSGGEVRMLLLSATPYKMYSTLEEIDESSVDEHYSEFFKVMEFLSSGEGEKLEFNEVWRNYSVQLRTYTQGDVTIIEAKNAAEDALFSMICRTERISAQECADMIDDSAAKHFLKPSDTDIKSYLEMQKLLDSVGAGYKVPVDYVKSSPYLLSFMREYQLKRHVEKYFKTHPGKLNEANRKLLWVQRSQIENFQKIDPANARLQYVQELAFEMHAEKLLWVPPSRPYYEMSGAFKGVEAFSKTLVFSSWEMVPRMLATMISYESERKNAQVLAKRSRQDAREARYFTSESGGKRYPAARLNFSISLGDPKGMPLFCLLYPSKSLAECFDPIDVLNRKMNFRELEREIKGKIQTLLSGLGRGEGTSRREDDRWYYLAPMLMDGAQYVSEWLGGGVALADYADLESGDDNKTTRRKQGGFLTHLETLAGFLHNPNLTLGKKPNDLLDVLTNMALASPAVCIMRSYQNIGGAGYRIDMPSQLAKVFINRMNTPESTAVIEVCSGKSGDDAHWKNLLAYCKDGNLQAVFDEYAHILVESNGLASTENRIAPLHNLIMGSMNVHTASYGIDTFNSLKSRIDERKTRPLNIRSHFAVAFTKSEGGVSKGIDRKESVRNSFNSPFRPFVLATTFIGQEGLDFHYYCRKIVHWNLPSNPIDIEQREGRINRYKCLAIRQNVANRYGDISFDDSVWYDMFSAASEKEKAESGSELVPYWGLAPSEDMVRIERIVPMYPFSRDISAYERLIKILSLYRLTLGQARQEELLEHLFAAHRDDDLSELFINLSPFYKNK